MASFQAKIGWKWMRKSESKNYQSVPTRSGIENSKKIVKNFKKLKNTILAFFSSQNRLEKDEKEGK